MSERMNEKLPFLNSQKKNHFFTQHNQISIRSLLRTKERRNFNEKKWLIYRFSALHPQMRERKSDKVSEFRSRIKRASDSAMHLKAAATAAPDNGISAHSRIERRQ
jgi:hypothetical protein